MFNKVGHFIIFLLIIFTASNILIYLNRDNGWQYIAYRNGKQINQPAFKGDKWTKKDAELSKEHLFKADSLLKSEIRFDSLSTGADRANTIAKWLSSSFELQLGPPEKQLNHMVPWEQFLYLKQHPNKKLWCGHLQEMFAFFATATGFINRKIEVVPRNDRDFHEINEVYLTDQDRWMMVDVTRGIFPGISASEYFDQMLTSTSLEDNYFNKNYFLRYYYQTDPKVVYSPIEKIKRYFFGNPWYEIYDPLSYNSNFLFRLKQFMLAVQVALVTFTIILLIAGRVKRYK